MAGPLDVSAEVAEIAGLRAPKNPRAKLVQVGEDPARCRGGGGVPGLDAVEEGVDPGLGCQDGAAGCQCDRGSQGQVGATELPYVPVVLAGALMSRCVRGDGDPSRANQLRAVLDAVFYVVRNGIEWRALPVDFPPWEAVYRHNNRTAGVEQPIGSQPSPVSASHPTPGSTSADKPRTSS